MNNLAYRAKNDTKLKRQN